MCNQFTFYLESATRYHSRTFHSNISQMHSGSILAASHFPHLSLVACNWRCGGWVCVTSPCRVLALGHHWPGVRHRLGTGPQTRVRCPHCGTESCPAHRPAPRRRTTHRQLRARARGNLPSVGRTTWASSWQSLCCRYYGSRYLVDWIFFIEYVKKSVWTLILINAATIRKFSYSWIFLFIWIHFTGSQCWDTCVGPSELRTNTRASCSMTPDTWHLTSHPDHRLETESGHADVCADRF